MKNNKGVTLILLIVTVIMLGILASVTVVTSIEAYKEMKFEGAKAELEEIQKLVNKIASDYQTYLKETDSNSTETSYVDYFNSRYNVSARSSEGFENKLLYQTENSQKASALIGKYPNIADAVNDSNKYFFYFTENDLIKYFNLKGISAVVVDFSTRTIYSVKGIEDPNDKSIIYYTASEWKGNTNIQKTATDMTNYTINTSIIENYGTTFDVQIQIEPKLSNEVFEVYYTTNDGDSYTKTDDFRDISNESATIVRVIITGSGTYNFRVVDSLKNYYDTLSIDVSTSTII